MSYEYEVLRRSVRRVMARSVKAHAGAACAPRAGVTPTTTAPVLAAVTVTGGLRRADCIGHARLTIACGRAAVRPRTLEPRTAYRSRSPVFGESGEHATAILTNIEPSSQFSTCKVCAKNQASERCSTAREMPRDDGHRNVNPASACPFAPSVTFAVCFPYTSCHASST